MKRQEKVSARIRPEYLREKDPGYIEKYEIQMDKYLYLDVELKDLISVDDVYKD